MLGRFPEAGRRVAEPIRTARGSTRRIAILGAVVILLAMMLVPTARAWFAQRSELDAARAEATRREASVVELQRQKALWADPAYVEAQARERLKFVKPGETAYTVIGAEKVTTSDSGTVKGTVVAPTDVEALPWYGQVWASVVLTDGLGRGTTHLGGATTAPAPSPTK